MSKYACLRSITTRAHDSTVSWRRGSRSDHICSMRQRTVARHGGICQAWETPRSGARIEDYLLCEADSGPAVAAASKREQRSNSRHTVSHRQQAAPEPSH